MAEKKFYRNVYVFELLSDEEKVYDYLYGEGGKPTVTSTSEIARRLGWKDSKVSQVKLSITKKLRAYL